MYGFTTFLFNDEVIQGVTKKIQNCVAICYNDINMLFFHIFKRLFHIIRFKTFISVQNIRQTS